MAYVRVWIHAVWSTKTRFPFLNDSIRQKVFKHMASNARSKRIVIDRINGYVDHVHCLIALRSTQSLAQVINQIKGESSRWINKNKLTKEHFEWQTDYFACSVGESAIAALRAYIDNQALHHGKTTLPV